MEHDNLQKSQQLTEHQQQYAELLRKYREDEKKLDQTQRAKDASEPDSPSVLAADLQRKHRQRLSEELMRILPLVDEANAICQSLGKHARFAVDLVSHPFTSAIPTEMRPAVPVPAAAKAAAAADAESHPPAPVGLDRTRTFVRGMSSMFLGAVS